MAGETITRAMQLADAEQVHETFAAAFAALDKQSGHTTPMSQGPVSSARVRIEHLLDTDPAGCWVAERDGRVIGMCMALHREGLWGLAGLAVDPGHQSSGAGRELLRRAHAYAEGATGRVIMASSDPRALRAYTNLGLAMSPAVAAHGKPRGVGPSHRVRPGDDGDLALIATIDREVRGAAHGSDIDALRRAGGELLVHPGRGYAIATQGDAKLVAALDREAAEDLLHSALAGSGDGPARVLWMTSEQQWAIDLCVRAGLKLDLGFGAVMRAGHCGTYRHYLPSGIYL